MTSILEIIGRDIPSLHSTTKGCGREWAGPCPWCGGEDRFRVWPEKGNYWCRKCERKGDAITYLRERDGLGYREACEALGDVRRLPMPPPRQAREAPRELLPGRDWRDRAAVAVDACEETLWGHNGERARMWLAARGLREDTLRRYRVGYSPGGEIAGHQVARGITIPWIEDGDVTHVKIRRAVRTEAQDGARYVSVTGGHPGLYGRDQRQGRSVLVLTEGEMDCLLLAQEAGDLADVWTLGSAVARVTTEQLWWMVPYRTVLLAYDADDAGDSGAQAVLDAGLRSTRRVPPPVAPPGKDIGDARAQGVDLRAWIEREIQA